MKFINKEGKLFDTINEAVGYICQQQEECGEWCPLYCKKPIPGCREFYLGNPIEAASLIGCKVADYEWAFVEPTKTVEKESGMDNHIDGTAEMMRPRICEVLGVEVGERFELKSTGIVLLVNDDGKIHISLSHGEHKETDLNVNYLVKAINDPDCIIRKPHFAEYEIVHAKNLLDVLGDGELKRVGDMTTLRVDGKIIYLRKGAFPSLKPEQSIKLSELADLSL